MENQENEQLSGKVTFIRYRNDTNFYTVASFQVNDEQEHHLTIVGYLPDIQTDVLYTIYGHYTEHPKYGMQFNVIGYDRPLPSEAEGVIRYLSGPQFPGIGPKTAEKIVASLGEACLDEIRKDPQILRQVPGLKDKYVDVITQGMKQEDQGMEELVRFLNIHGIGMRNLARLNKAYGKDALAKLRENPYRVIEECDGFGFQTADKLAQSMGFAKDDERRLYAFLVQSVMDLCVRTGNSYVRIETLEAYLAKKMKGIDYDFGSMLDRAVVRRSLVQEDNRIYPKTQYEAETYTADFLSHFPKEEIDACDMDIMHGYLDTFQEKIGITYDETQLKAIDSFFTSPFMIMTGGPGTGKTTLVHAFVKLFAMMYPSASIVCAAPTGRAAKRLSELTDNGSATIHSLLQWDLESNTFGMNEDNPIHADLLIIDEFSMVDDWLFYNLLKASAHVKKICVIGDEDQLPSVGPGSVLRDLIASSCFPVIRLTHIYRQKGESEVIQLARDIREGKWERDRYHNDVAFYDCDEANLRKGVLQIVEAAVRKGYSLDDIQVLSPMYGGSGGIDVLNNALQECFNPKSEDKREMKHGYLTFREGDKILQLRNQPDDDVYNGDIGTLEEIIEAKESENHQRTIVVDFQGNFVEYSGDSLNNIALAYCISIHKSQGSEYPIVILPISRRHRIMMRRNVIYTGITRARRSLVLLGDANTFAQAVETLEIHPRETTLAQRLSCPSDGGTA